MIALVMCRFVERLVLAHQSCNFSFLADGFGMILLNVRNIRQNWTVWGSENLTPSLQHKCSSLSSRTVQALQNMQCRFQVEWIVLFKLKINFCHTIHYWIVNACQFCFPYRYYKSPPKPLMLGSMSVLTLYHNSWYLTSSQKIFSNWYESVFRQWAVDW